MQDVRLSTNREIGVSVSGIGTTFEARNFLVDDTLGQLTVGNLGVGLKVALGAGATVENARFYGNRDKGLAAQGADTTLVASRVLVDATQARQDDEVGGWGLWADSAAQVNLQDVRLTKNREYGVSIKGPGTTLTATNVIVDATDGRQTDGSYGLGIATGNDAHVFLEAVRLSANHHIGLFIEGAKTEVGIGDLLIDGTLPQKSDKKSGVGLFMRAGAQVTLADARLSANCQIGLGIEGPSSKLEASRLVIDGTLPQQSDNTYGFGASVAKGAVLILHDARFSNNHVCGLAVADTGTTAEVARTLVDGTLAEKNSKMYGRGLTLQDGATLDVLASRITGNRDFGVLALYGATLHGVGVAIDATMPEDYFQLQGAGVSLAEVVATFVASFARGNHGYGLSAYKSTVTANDFVVAATTAGKFPEFDADNKATGADTALADGVELLSSPNSSLDQCLILANERSGVLVASSAGVKVTRNLINGGKGLYGLVFQNTLDAVDQFNLVFGSSLQDRAKDAGLTLPAPPQPVKTL